MDEIWKVYVGPDVHKESIAIEQAAPGREPARLLGEIAHDVNCLIKKLAPSGDPGSVPIVYEAGPRPMGCSASCRLWAKPPQPSAGYPKTKYRGVERAHPEGA